MKNRHLEISIHKLRRNKNKKLKNKNGERCIFAFYLVRTKFRKSIYTEKGYTVDTKVEQKNEMLIL